MTKYMEKSLTQQQRDSKKRILLLQLPVGCASILPKLYTTPPASGQWCQHGCHAIIVLAHDSNLHES